MRLSLVAVLACCLLLGWRAGAALTATSQEQPSPTRVTAKAVWNPAPGALDEIRRKCAAGDPAQHEACFVGAMQSAGASDEAVAFVKDFAPDNGLAYIRAFRDTGRVDIAYIEYLFRANELDGVLLVNGTPPFIDVDDDKYISKEDLRKNADFAVLLKKYPNASVFSADRYHEESPENTSGSGRQSFRIEYLILNGCHACARIGTLLASFEFDESGHFEGVRALRVRPGGDNDYDRPELQRRDESGGANVNPTEIQSQVGASITIPLEANHTTGYSWRLAQPPDPAVLKQVSNNYEGDTSGRMGAGGKETWTFQATGKGTATLVFEYLRPFEKNVPPARTAKYEVEVK